jgi:hypothetical protein
MVSSNLCVDLDVRMDKLDNVYFLGRLCFPGQIDFSNGLTIIIFTSESGSEQIQLCPNNSENTTFSKYSRKDDRLKIDISERQDAYGKIYYIAKILFNGYIDCSEEITFMIFNSRKGLEQIQVVGEIVQRDRPLQKKTIEVYQGAETKSIEL